MILKVILNLALMKTQSLGGLDEKSLLLFCKLTPIKVYRPHRLTGGGLRYLQMPCNRPSNQHCLPYLCFCQTVFPGGDPDPASYCPDPPLSEGGRLGV